MNILVLNCGSSSLKFQVIETGAQLIQEKRERLIASGLIERIGSQALITLKPDGGKAIKLAQPLRNHKEAIEFVLEWLVNPESNVQGIQTLGDLHAVGHRVVHGGERFSQSVRIDDQVIAGIEDCIELAPLHNPANLRGIASISEILGAGIPQVGVFDTAFHAQMPASAFLYAIPYQFYRRYKIRRYGFHGTSHRYVSQRYGEIRGTGLESMKLITLHLGNGCSACAIRNGVSVHTSMGFTPLEGIVMGTRSGDIDPAIMEYLALKEGMSPEQIDGMLNKQSGLLGVSGITHDMRELLDEERENNDRRAHLAIEIFVASVRKYVGAYLAELNGADAILFAGGIGENSPRVRERICGSLDRLGIKLDATRNAACVGVEGEISTDDSPTRIFVVPTNEELLIARDTALCVGG